MRCRSNLSQTGGKARHDEAEHREAAAWPAEVVGMRGKKTAMRPRSARPGQGTLARTRGPGRSDGDGRAERSTHRSSMIDRASTKGGAVHGVRTAETHVAGQHRRRMSSPAGTMKRRHDGAGIAGIFKFFSNPSRDAASRDASRHHAPASGPASCGHVAGSDAVDDAITDRDVGLRPGRASCVTLALRLVCRRPTTHAAPAKGRRARAAFGRDHRQAPLEHSPNPGRAMQQSRTMRSHATRPRRSAGAWDRIRLCTGGRR